MKRFLIIGGAVFGAALGIRLLIRRFAFNSGGSMWEKMIDRMPDTAPPKWMFRNIAAIRENTDQILELLKSRGVAAQGNAEEGAKDSIAVGRSTP